jgi:hypothetical protein
VEKLEGLARGSGMHGRLGLVVLEFLEELEKHEKSETAVMAEYLSLG